MGEITEQLSQAIIVGDVGAVTSLTKQGLDQGLGPKELLDDGLLAGMDVVGRRFKSGEMFIPEVLRCAKAMHGAMDVLKPLLAESGAPSSGKLVIGTVKGDLHDIGKNLVGMMFEGAGFQVINLGVDIPPEKFVEAVKEHDPDIVAMSALLTTTMSKMGETIEALKKAGLRDSVKVMVGGAPVTDAFAEKIGADAYTANAGSAVERGLELIK